MWREAAVSLREAAASREEAAPSLGSLMVQNEISPRLGFHVGGVTPLIPGTFVLIACFTARWAVVDCSSREKGLHHGCKL
jgi:hypothetical protein